MVVAAEVVVVVIVGAGVVVVVNTDKQEEEPIKFKSMKVILPGEQGCPGRKVLSAQKQANVNELLLSTPNEVGDTSEPSSSWNIATDIWSITDA